MKYTVLMLLMLLPILLAAGAVELISQSQDELILQFTLPDYKLEDFTYQGETRQRIVCDDANSFGEEGFPGLKSFSEALGIPVDGEIMIELIGHKNTVLSGVDLAPAPTIVLDGDGVDYAFQRDNRAYNRKSLYPETLFSKGEAAFIGNRRFIPLEFYPFQYRAASKELVVNQSIRVKVTIQGSKTQAKDWLQAENPLDSVADSFFINNQTSRAWRLPKQTAENSDQPKNVTSRIDRIQLIVDSEGIYKITYSYLKDYMDMMADSLGLDYAWTVTNVDPRYLELSDENGQIPITFNGEADGNWDPGDYFEFYGDRHYGDTGYQDDYTAENVYHLSLLDHFGARMMVENGGLTNSNPSQYIVPDSFESTVHLEEQLVNDKLGHNWTAANPTFYKEDVWFWKRVSAPDLDIVPFELQYPRDSTIRTANAKVVLHGLTYSESLYPGQWDHEATVRVNQAMINTHTWVGQTEKVFQNQNPIPNTYFRHGTNYFYISLSGNTVMADREQVMLDYAELTYWREYKTSQDWIKFTKPSHRPPGLYQFELQGFSSSDVSLYKIGSSVFNNLQIEPYSQDGAAPWTVTFQDSVKTNSVRFFAVTEAQKKAPKKIRLDIPSNLKSPSNTGDVIVITADRFINAEGTQTLKTLWEDNGYSVNIVDIQDIYDEFNAGIVSGEAIKDFATYAYNNWANPQLKHLILLGEGVDDTRDNSPSRLYNVIPVKKTWTYKHGATASDNWYGCIVGTDIVADISVARINVWKPEQILDYANKALRYYNEPQANRLWNSHVTFTTGGKITDGNDIFAQQSERILRKNVPSKYRATRVYTSTQTVSHDYFGGTFDLKDAINSGTNYVQFMGHGGGRIWADYNLFNFNDVATLNNSTYPVILSLACYASAFDTNGASSISEALVLQANKGAIGTVGFSGLGYLDQDEDFGLAITEAIYKHNFQSLGDALTFTKARFYTTTSSSAPRYALTHGCAYLGDPMIKMRKPVSGIEVSAQNLSLAVGDTLRVQAQFPSGVVAAQLRIMKESGKVVNVPYDLPVIQGAYNASYVIPANQGNNYLRRIYVSGYSSDTEYIGEAMFGVGRASVYHHQVNPVNPTWQDSIAFSGKVFSPPGSELISLTCRVRTDSLYTGGTWVSLPMVSSGTDTYTTSQKLSPQRTGKEIFYKYIAVTTGGTYESFLTSTVVRGPDLLLSDIQLLADNQEVRLKVLVKNIGDAASIPTDLSLYYTPSGGASVFHSSQTIEALGVAQERWEYIDLSTVPPANLMFEVRVNFTNVFPEWHLFYNTNNIITLRIPFNYQIVNSTGAVLNSVDSNVSCEIPPNLVDQNSSSIFYVHRLEQLTATDQPDIAPIFLRSTAIGSNKLREDNDGPKGTGNIVAEDHIPRIKLYSTPYEIRTLDRSLVDSTGTFLNGKRIKLYFFYNVTDSLTQAYESENSYKIFRWNSTYNKWLVQGGNVSSSANMVVFEVNREGIYTIYRNRDRTGPSIDVNVQDQEFTVGGYISGKGIISLLVSDTNGINVMDDAIRLYLNGEALSPDQYAIALGADNLNRIPIKYQLDLPKGNYTLLVDCTDVNGNYNSRAIQFFVNDSFDVVNIGNYPNPVPGVAQDPKNDGRTRFTYVLTDDADDVTIKVYTISGRLVKTFSNLPGGVGYHEYPRTVYGWDCRDDAGYFLANGTYFYKVIARRGSKKIEKTMKMAILK